MYMNVAAQRFIRANYSGFTLLELLIVVSLIAIMSGGILPAFSQYIDDQNMRQAQEQLKSDLRSIQNRALTGSAADQYIGTNPVQYWGVRFNADDATYVYFISEGNASAQCNDYANNGRNQGEFVLTEGLEMKHDGCVFFSLDNGDFNGVNIGADNRVIFGNTDSTPVCRSVFINSGGLIINSTNNGCT